MINVGFQLVSIDTSNTRGLGRDGVGEIPVKDGGTLADAMRMVGLSMDQQFMTLINGNPVAPEARTETPLADEDQIVVFPPIENN